MANEDIERPELSGIIKIILLASLVILLPAVQWSFFGWLHVFLPLLSFFLLGRYGGHTGKRLLLTAAALSLIIYLILDSLDLFIFSAALLFSGFVLHRSVERQESPALSGFKAAVSLAGSWFVVLTVFSAGSEISAYGQLLKTFDQGIVETLEHYRQSDTVSTETLIVLETTLHRMQLLVPMIMPAILGSIILMITWLTMMLGNILLLKTCDKVAWAGYRYWQLPERLIWVVIVIGILALIPTHPVRAVGINSLILLSIVYCFQGLAILVFFMDKWNVPLLLRSFLYVMIVFQSLGTLILLLFGIADSWFDFRKLKLVTTDKTE
ncbi:MAG: hypothetical protein VR65_10490 [Desulfobulbaceae bacterium BRH_c16a]|nr:MAG: hypothetical protein VR65_10490 [Desulfobulbaceae bacterium BRH_c16a]